MADETVGQLEVVTQAAPNPEVGMGQVALFHPDGTPVIPGSVATATTATAIGTAAKVVTTPAPAANTFIAIKYTSGNSADSATVAFAGGSAIPIKLGGTASTGAKHTLAANGVGVYFYDGTTLNQLGVIS